MIGQGVRVDPAEYLALPLEAHALLRDAPLKDVSAIDLPGGGPGRTIVDVHHLVGQRQLRHTNLLVRALFALRMLLGRLFGWDRQRPGAAGDWSYLSRLPPALRERSLVPPGTAEGEFHYLYVLPEEAVSEIRNATVHALICAVLVPRGDGYRMYWGIYVKPVSWLTPVYIRAIEPFRRLVVYPAIFAGIRRAWQRRYPA